MTLDASASVRIQARTATYPWRAFLDGRIGLRGPVSGSGSWRSDSELHRLYVRRYFPQGQVSLGKQFVNWGVGYAFSPTDVFNPPDPTDPSAIRPGIVAATVQWSVGPLDYWHLAAAIGKYGLRRRGNVGGTDWSLLAVSDDGRTILGFDLDGDLGIGWHAAAAYYLPKKGSHGHWHGLIGADYSWLEGRLLWLGEYAFHALPSSRGAGRDVQQLFQQLDVPARRLHLVVRRCPLYRPFERAPYVERRGRHVPRPGDGAQNGGYLLSPGSANDRGPLLPPPRTAHRAVPGVLVLSS